MECLFFLAGCVSVCAKTLESCVVLAEAIWEISEYGRRSELPAARQMVLHRFESAVLT